MHYNPKIIGLMVLILLNFSCIRNSLSYKTVIGENYYSIEVPERFIKRTDLHRLSYLQLSDQVRPFYVLVLADSKTNLKKLGLINSLSSYCDFVLESLANSVRADSIIKFIQPPDAGYKGYIYQIFGSDLGKNDKEKLFAILGVFESEKCFYQVISWIEQPIEKNELEEIKHIVGSFKEIKNQPANTPIAPD